MVTAMLSGLKEPGFNSRKGVHFCSHHMLDRRDRITIYVAWSRGLLLYVIIYTPNDIPPTLNRLQKVWWSDVKQTIKEERAVKWFYDLWHNIVQESLRCASLAYVAIPHNAIEDVQVSRL